MMESLPPIDTRRINTEVFEKTWSRSHWLKERLQYNLETTRKDFLYVLKKLNISPESQLVLDIGFGNGRLMFSFRPSSRIWGTEFSLSAIQLAERKAKKRRYSHFSFVSPIDPEKLPFDSAGFDVVIASHVLEHVVRDVDFLTEMMRVLKPRGHLILFVPLDNPTGGILTEEELMNPGYVQKGHFHVRNYNWETLQKRLEEQGAQIVFHTADMHFWDWKVSLDPWRIQLSKKVGGRFIDFIIAAALNIPLAIAPRWAQVRLDKILAANHYHPRQAVFAIRK